MPTMEIPFAIGEKVWAARPSYEESCIECPDCCGKKVLTIVKKDGFSELQIE